MGPVASLLAMDRTTLTAALKPLQRRGLVEIDPDPNDKRSRILKLTDEGAALLARAFPEWKRTHTEIEKRISSPETMRRNLQALS